MFQSSAQLPKDSRYPQRKTPHVRIGSHLSGGTTYLVGKGLQNLYGIISFEQYRTRYRTAPADRDAGKNTSDTFGGILTNLGSTAYLCRQFLSMSQAYRIPRKARMKISDSSMRARMPTKSGAHRPTRFSRILTLSVAPPTQFVPPALFNVVCVSDLLLYHKMALRQFKPCKVPDRCIAATTPCAAYHCLPHNPLSTS